MASLAALLSSLLWGGGDFIGGTMSRRLPVAAVFGISQACALIALVIAVVATGAWSASLGYIPWAIASSILGMVGILAFYRALALGPMGIVAPFVGLAVVIPVAFGLVQDEVPAGMQVLGIVIAVVGILLASGPELSTPQSAKPLALAVLALVCFGTVYITMAEGAQYSTLMTTTGMRVVSVGVFAVVAIFARSLGGVRKPDLPALALLGILDAGANIAYGWATTQGMLTTVAVLGSIYPVVTALLAAIFLHERLKPVQYVGAAATVVAIVMISAGG